MRQLPSQYGDIQGGRWYHCLAGSYGYKPDFSNLRVIGCHAYIHDKKAKKLDPKAIKCRHVGYEGSGARVYRLIDSSGKVIRNSSVHFDDVLPAESFKRQAFEGNPERGVQPMVVSESPSPISAPFISGNNDPDPDYGPIDNLDDDDPATIGRNHTEGSSSHRTSRSTRNAANVARQAVANANRNAVNAQAEGETMVMTAPGVWEPAIRVQSPASSNSPSGAPHITQRCLLTALLHAEPEDDPIEPLSYNDFIKSSGEDQVAWRGAMVEEKDSLIENNKWTLTDPLPGKKVLRGKWAYKPKRGANGEITRCKARWVVRGFEQIEGRDYHETFASVVKPMSYKALFAIAAARDYEIEQMDVKTAFLYGTVEEELYVEQPTGCEDGTTRVCRLNKALYGLKQSPRIWYNMLTEFLASHGYHPITMDSSIYRKDRTYIAVYVDDLLIVGPSSSEISSIKGHLNTQFKMTDLGPCSFYLGMQVIRDRRWRTLCLSQAGYINQILRRFYLKNEGYRTLPMRPDLQLTRAPAEYLASHETRLRYQSAVGSLMYAMLGTRPDTAFAVSVVSRYASNPTEDHWKAVVRIFAYLNKTRNLQLVFRGAIQPLTGYSDADWAGDRDTRRSTGGYKFDIGSGAFSWSSKRQPTIALSSCEAGYMAETQATKEAICLQKLLKRARLRRW